MNWGLAGPEKITFLCATEWKLTGGGGKNVCSSVHPLVHDEENEPETCKGRGLGQGGNIQRGGESKNMVRPETEVDPWVWYVLKKYRVNEAENPKEECTYG